MSVSFKPKVNTSLRKNAHLLFPLLIDDFLSYRKLVMKSDSYVTELHQMRIAGKTLRYTMETFQPLFNKKFDACFNEVKQVLEILGNIHDCDICIATMNDYIVKQKTEGESSGSTSGEISPFTLLIQSQQKLRKKLYLEFCTTMRRWKKENIATSIIGSLE